MDLEKLAAEFSDCACGHKHEILIDGIYVESGLVVKVGKILKKHNFGNNILVVADENTMTASLGIKESLTGFNVLYKIYADKREAFMTDVDEIVGLVKNADAVLSVGTGSLNDICRLACHRTGKKLAIFATAPSMDGFASCDAPIIENGFKSSYKATQPSVIIADTKILSDAPAHLKSAGFGDMMGKYIALVDWNTANILTGEYYCDKVAKLSLGAVKKLSRLSKNITKNDEKTAAAIMEGLVLTGIAMGFTHSSRPASGSEHIISHFLDIMLIAQGIQPAFHGHQVGVASLLVTRLYKGFAAHKKISAGKDNTDWEQVYKVYANMRSDIERLNDPSVTDQTAAEIMEKSWTKIREFIDIYLPSPKYLEKIMKEAGCPTTIGGINVSQSLWDTAVKFHPYMRHRMSVMRMLPAIKLL
jgi:glycerol-1-phosphate dehydrogenase [NAD(P)+]